MARVRSIDPLVDGRWDDYVVAHPRATVYHLAAWSLILRQSYGVRPTYLTFEEGDGTLGGVLPLASRRGLISGSRLVSLPLVHQAGPLADSPDREAELLRAAADLADERAVPLVVRSATGGYEVAVGDLAVIPEAPSWVIRLDPDLERIRRRWPGNLRRDVARSEREISVREGVSEGDLRRFYRLYLRAMKEHGVAPRPWRQMVLCWRQLRPAGRLRLLIAERESRTVGAAVLHLLGERVEVRYMASDREYLSHRPNHALYWAMIKSGAAEGYGALDLGGGTGSLVAFKRRWGAEVVALYRYVHTPSRGRRRAIAPTLGGDEGRQSRERAPSATIWRHLPTPLSRFAGSLVYRYL